MMDRSASFWTVGRSVFDRLPAKNVYNSTAAIAGTFGTPWRNLRALSSAVRALDS